jgi:hypothetical protein
MDFQTKYERNKKRNQIMLKELKALKKSLSKRALFRSDDRHIHLEVKNLNLNLKLFSFLVFYCYIVIE